jgi:long-chain-fatty-acid--[acyl-carrier-protein] ligase
VFRDDPFQRPAFGETRVINALIRAFVKTSLWLRYRIHVDGVDAIAQRGSAGILFLPNHPALIDPIIVMAYLHGRFRLRPLADKDQINRFFIGWLARRVGARPIPDVRAHSPSARAEVEGVVADCIAGLKRGENLLLYPAGHIYRARHENLRGNSAVERILLEIPDLRVVLVRTRGLWGSDFSLAAGQFPNVARVLKRGAGFLAANFLVFSPRRAVTLDLHEPADLPRGATRSELNAYLERFYNADAPPAMYVPHLIWERGGIRVIPEPEFGHLGGSATQVPESTRDLVTAYLREAAGAATLRDEDRLAEDLGIDSLAKAELMLWLGKEFGFAAGDVDALHTVGDVLLAACGEAIVARPVELKPVPARWSAARGQARVAVPPGETLTDVFLEQARRDPDRAVVADQLSGVRTYRDLIAAIFALRPSVQNLPGDHVGIMLPASVAACVTYLVTLFAGKTPLMVNWTAGTRALGHVLDLAGVRHILTSRPLVSRIEGQGTDFGNAKDRFVYLEDLRRQLSRWRMFGAALRSHVSWRTLAQVRVPPTAVVLVTSGSESLPKAVPLTHANLLANLRDVLSVFTIREDDCLIGFLPPFHSFGLTVTTLLPLLAGARAVYHANPTEAWVLARLIEMYGATVLCGTPTFLSGIVRAGSREQLATLRLAVTGAEKCPERTYEALAERCPRAVILEGYGITECSPIVAATREDASLPGTIGKVMPSVEYALVDEATGAPAPVGEPGMLLVRGPSVFGGYLGQEVASPFVEFAGQKWYRTGDLVSSDAAGVLTFRGRLKRFIKLGGEMVSLPAIEAVLEAGFVTDADEGPVLAVEATPREDHPEIVLFALRDIDRQTANRLVREAGLSALHNVSRVVRLEQMPVLGTGKTDYRALRTRLAQELSRC